MRPSGKALLVVVAIAAVIAAVVIFVPHPGAKDFRSSLATALNVPKDDLFLNVPPAARRYPGSVFATAQWLPLEQTDANDPSLVRGAPFALALSQLDAASAEGGVSGGFFGEILSHRDAVDLSARVDSGVVLEVPIPVLKRRLLASEAVLTATDRGARPVVITRAYQGILTLSFKRKQGASAQAWADVAAATCRATGACGGTNSRGGTAGRSGATSGSITALADSARLKGDASNTGEITFTIPGPVVFAFQAMEASYVTGHLGASGPDSVALRPLSPADVARLTSASVEVAPVAAAPPWALLTIAVNQYPRLHNSDQPWHDGSAALVRDALAPYRPRYVAALGGTAQHPLAESDVLTFVDTTAARARIAGVRAIVVYFVGHTFALPGADVTLLMGDATDRPKMPKRDAPTLGASVSGRVAVLSDFANQLEAAVEQPTEGLLHLGRVYEALERTHVPFALLIDGCLESDQVSRFRESLGLMLGPGATNRLVYAGSAETATFELGAFADLLRHYADEQPYLHGQNPVVLAAKPGTLAESRTDPRWAWGESVGPLAARLERYVRASRLDADPPSLGEVVRQSAEYRGLGEISSRGSISWSDFSRWTTVTDDIRPPRVL